MFNRIILIGNLTKDPDVRYTPSGTPVTTLSIAVNSRFKQGEETRDEVLFMDVVVFGRQAESTGQYLNKGNPVLVEGRLRERKWEYEGQKKSKFEVIANTIKFLPKRDQRQSGGGANIQDITPPDEFTENEPF